MIKRDVDITKQDQKKVTEAVVVLVELCKVVTSIGLTVVTFGQAYSETLLYLYGGEVLTKDYLPTQLLKCHCFAVLLLAINGITECYVFATMNNKQLDRYNYIMVIFSIAFLVISFVFTYFLGPIGFIIANCFNMLARIVHSISYIEAKYSNTNFIPLEGLIPENKFMLVLIFSGFITQTSEYYFYQHSLVTHIFIGAGCFMLTVCVWASDNKDLLARGLSEFQRRLSVKTD